MNNPKKINKYCKSAGKTDVVHVNRSFGCVETAWYTLSRNRDLCDFYIQILQIFSQPDIITASLVKSARMNIGRWFLYLLDHLVLFPVIIFFGFAILAILLGFLGKNQSTGDILLVSIALVGAIRVTAYYSEDLSKDLAKMLPFTLMGIYIVDRSYFDFSISLKLLTGIPDYWTYLVYYFAFIVVLELILRTIFDILNRQPENSVMVLSSKGQKTDNNLFCLPHGVPAAGGSNPLIPTMLHKFKRKSPAVSWCGAFSISFNIFPSWERNDSIYLKGIMRVTML